MLFRFVFALRFLRAVLDPIHGHNVSRNEQQVRRDPGNGIGKAKARISPNLDEHEGSQRPAAQLGNARKHRDHAFAHALQGVAVNEDRSERQINTL